MSRAEFSKATKREAVKRSGGLCEAVGKIFGLRPGKRCNASLAKGLRFEHIDPDANSKNNSLENCGAVCLVCWRWKTDHYDKPLVAKTTRQQDKHSGVTGPKRSWPSRKMNSPRFENTKRLEEL